MGRASSLPRWESVTCAPAVSRAIAALGRRIPSADDEDARSRELLRIVEAVEDLVGPLLARHAEAPVAAAAPDGDDDATGPRRYRARAVSPRGVVQPEPVAAPLDALDPGERHREIGFAHPPFHPFEQLLLRVDLALELEVALRRHARRVGVDRFALREARHRREGLRGFEDPKANSTPARPERRGDTRDAGADDRDVDLVGLGRALAREAGLGQDCVDRSGARVGGELQERHAGQVPDDPHARHGGRAVRARLRPLLDGAGRPHRVEPARIAAEETERRGHAGSLRRAGRSGAFPSDYDPPVLEATRRAGSSRSARPGRAPRAAAEPGIFAAGDVRAGSGKRVAAAVGEGSATVSMVHRYLETV